MKKILRDILFLVMGGVVIGGIGITATNYAIGANEVKYTDLEGNEKDVKQAIDGLYVKLDKVATNIETLPTGVKAIVYLDPTDLTKECNQFNSTSTTGTKSGCMKWYAYAEDDESYTMILDHNTTAKVKGSEASSQLTTDTAGWSGNPRLIHAQEVADITGNTSWTARGSGFYFNGNTSGSQTTGSNIYYWLFDYTKECTNYGCKVKDSSNNGYWTDTAVVGNSTHVWDVTYDGCLFGNGANYAYYGIRPVIAISKSTL